MSYKRSEYVGPDGKYLNPFFPESQLTADIFWKYFPIEVRELRDTLPKERMALAFELLVAGYRIVSDVMIFEVDPVTYINLCYNQGYRHVPVMGQAPVMVAPGVSFPGLPSYDPNKPPLGSFPISLDPAAYPPVDPPVVLVEPPPGLTLVGNYMGRGAEGLKLYGAGPGAAPTTVKNGESYIAPDGTKVKARVNSAGIVGMGWSVNFIEV